MPSKKEPDSTNKTLAELWEEIRKIFENFVGDFIGGFCEFQKSKEYQKLKKKLTEEEFMDLYAAVFRILKPKGVNKK